MPYNINIPQPTDKLSQSQADILSNFQAINTLVSVNHGTFGAADEGKHKFVQLPQQGSDTTTAAAEVALYAKNDTDTGNTELFFRRPSNGAVISTTAASFTANGWTMLPSGIMLQWGSATMGGGSSQQDFALPRAFPTAILSVTATPNDTPSGNFTDIIMAIQALSTTQIRAKRKTNFGTPCSFNYLAIGY